MPIELSKLDSLEDVEPREQSAGKSNEELLARLSEEGLATREVADFLGIQQVSANSRLRRLEENGEVFRKYDPETKKQYWFATSIIE
jgi:DNA-binding MarR family transcriptional regulator